MKKLGLLILIVSFKLAAQDVVINPPLSVDTEAGRTMVQEERPKMSSSANPTPSPVATPATSPAAPVVEIKGSKSDAKKKSDKSAEKKSSDIKKQVDSDYATDADTNSVHKEVLKAPYAQNADDFDPSETYEKYIQFSSGVINSKWKKISPTLGNGSTTTEFKIAADMSSHNQIGFAVEIIHQKGGDTSAENVRALQYKFFWEHHRPVWHERFDWLMGLALSSGDYSVFDKTVVGGVDNYTKIKSGAILGVIPTFGFKLYLVGKNSLDVAVEYHYYFAKPQRYIGGFALAPRFSFVF